MPSLSFGFEELSFLQITNTSFICLASKGVLEFRYRSLMEPLFEAGEWSDSRGPVSTLQVDFQEGCSFFKEPLEVPLLDSLQTFFYQFK